MLWEKLKDKLGRCFPVPGIMQKVRRWLVESEEREAAEEETAQSPDGFAGDC